MLDVGSTGRRDVANAARSSGRRDYHQGRSGLPGSGRWSAARGRSSRPQGGTKEAQPFGREKFLDRVAAIESIDRPTAERHARTALTAVRVSVPERELPTPWTSCRPTSPG